MSATRHTSRRRGAPRGATRGRRPLGSAAGAAAAPVGHRFDHWVAVAEAARTELAVVYWARPESASDGGCDYALKCLQPAVALEAVAVEGFRRSAECGAAMCHPHLIPVLASRVMSPPYYIVMPRLRAVTVRSVLSDHITFTIPQALWIARQVAAGLAALHAQGWVHGDIQPSNVMVDAAGHATVIDYGFAVPMTRPVRSREWLQTTLSYAAPELLTSTGRSSPASDVYSLGVLLFEMLTGRTPFRIGDPARLAEAHLTQPAPSARSYLPQLPRSVSQLLGRMLAKAPERRPSVAYELQDELAALEFETFALRS